MPKKRFINKNDVQNTKTFQLVHRSQRDVRITDESASPYVLKEVIPASAAKKQGHWHLDVEDEELKDHVDWTRFQSDDEDYESEEGDWEDEKGSEGLDEDLEEEDVENVEKNLAKLELQDTKPLEKSKKPVKDNIGTAVLYGINYDDRDYDYTQHLRPIGQHADAVFVPAKTSQKEKHVGFQLPEEALPGQEQEVGLLNQTGEDEADFSDPDVAEALDALDDEDNFEDLDDDFFDQLNADELPEKLLASQSKETKQSKPKVSFKDEPQEEYSSEYEDVTDESGFEDSDEHTTPQNLSSAHLPRNQNLALLDKRFEKVLDEYKDEELGEGHEQAGVGPSADDQAYEEVFEEFLATHDDKGREVTYETRRGVGQLDELRRDLKGLVRPVDLQPAEDVVTSESEEEPEEQWDAETILTSYTNIYNHPTFIKDGKKKPIELDPHTGMPIEFVRKREKDVKDVTEVVEEEEVTERVNLGKPRNKSETAEEKKARKEALKQAHRNRRVEKKQTKEMFRQEAKKGKSSQSQTVGTSVIQM